MISDQPDGRGGRESPGALLLEGVGVPGRDFRRDADFLGLENKKPRFVGTKRGFLRKEGYGPAISPNTLPWGRISVL